MSDGGQFDVKLQRRAIVAAALVMILFSLVSPPEDSDSNHGPASTLRAGPGGALALFETLDALGFESTRLHAGTEGLNDRPDADGVLVLLAPTELLTRADQRRIMRWIKRGGTLIYAPNPEHATLLEKLGVEYRGGDHVGLAPTTDGRPLVRRILADAPDTGYECPERFLVSSDGRFSPLIATPDGLAACGILSRGDGHAILIADVAPLTNTSILDSPLVPVVVRALSALAEGSAVRFDEYHHGYKGGMGAAAATWRWLSGSAEGWAVLSLAVIAFISLITSGIRLGPPVPVQPRPRRSSLEHVDALAASYQRSRAHALPRDRLIDGLRLSLRVGDLEKALRQAEVSFPDLDDHISRVRSAVQAAPGERGAELVPLTASIDQLLRALRKVPNPAKELLAP